MTRRSESREYLGIMYVYDGSTRESPKMWLTERDSFDQQVPRIENNDSKHTCVQSEAQKYKYGEQKMEDGSGISNVDGVTNQRRNHSVSIAGDKCLGSPRVDRTGIGILYAFSIMATPWLASTYKLHWQHESSASHGVPFARVDCESRWTASKSDAFLSRGHVDTEHWFVSWRVLRVSVCGSKWDAMHQFHTLTQHSLHTKEWWVFNADRSCDEVFAKFWNHISGTAKVSHEDDPIYIDATIKDDSRPLRLHVTVCPFEQPQLACGTLCGGLCIDVWVSLWRKVDLAQFLLSNWISLRGA